MSYMQNKLARDITEKVIETVEKDIFAKLENLESRCDMFRFKQNLQHDIHDILEANK
jgi:hypothetical protein